MNKLNMVDHDRKEFGHTYDIVKGLVTSGHELYTLNSHVGIVNYYFLWIKDVKGVFILDGRGDAIEIAECCRTGHDQFDIAGNLVDVLIMLKPNPSFHDIVSGCSTRGLSASTTTNGVHSFTDRNAFFVAYGFNRNDFYHVVYEKEEFQTFGKVDL